MNVLSLFDGMSCGRIALERAKIKVDHYFACEIDKYASSVSQYNWNDVIPVGDVTKLHKSQLGDVDIDLLIGGSPCQGFSKAQGGKQLNFDDPRSVLFFEYVRLLKECKPKYFLLENVRMSQESEDIITEYLGVEPIAINSSLVSAQSRHRLYWTNIPFDGLPEDKEISLIDILEQGIEPQGKLTNITNKEMSRDGMCQVGEAEEYAHYNYRSTKVVYSPLGKCPTLLTMQGGNREPKVAIGHDEWRKLTVKEIERVQTVPDDYTEFGIVDPYDSSLHLHLQRTPISNTQRKKMIGNGWTVDVLTHIFGGLQSTKATKPVKETRHEGDILHTMAHHSA